MSGKPETQRQRDERALLAAVEQATQLVGVQEHRFHPERKWRLDLAWPEVMVALEVQGGLFVQGKHGRGEGASRDHEKLNEAQLSGWIVIQCQPREIASEQVREWVLRAIARQRENLADWMPDDTVTLAADPRANERAGALADETL